MSGYNVAPLSRLVEQFERLPGIGRKSAQRLAYFVLQLPDKEAKAFADAILEAHEKIHYCKVCCNLTDQELCPVCRNETRDRSVICVVEDPRDVMALERTHEFKATYHCPARRDFPWEASVPSSFVLRSCSTGFPRAAFPRSSWPPILPWRARRPPCISPGFEAARRQGYATAYGIPVGRDLEYADEVTLARALEGRSEM